MSKFVLDANIFIEAYHRYYSFDIVPSFWVLLKKKISSGDLISIDRVYEEINKFNKDDELKNWVCTEACDCFIPSNDNAVIEEYRKIMKWAMSQNQFIQAAKNEFANVADAWLIAFAKVYKYTLVTHEELKPGVRRKIPIPNVCKVFNVPYINTFEMMRQLEFKI